MEGMEKGGVTIQAKRFFDKFFSRIFLQSFTLTFLAEWGDRSQIATIILGAREVMNALSDANIQLFH